MSVRAFAEYLGVGKTTVSGWESRDRQLLRLATQAVLDQALTLADADTKTRFVLILASVPDCASGAGTGTARSMAPTGVPTSEYTDRPIREEAALRTPIGSLRGPNPPGS